MVPPRHQRSSNGAIELLIAASVNRISSAKFI